jgi:hypothetical protein
MLDGLRFVNFVVIHDHIDVVIMTSRIAGLERVEQISEQRIGFARPGTIMNDSGATIPGTYPIMFLVLAGVSTSTCVPFGIHGQAVFGSQ